MLTELVMLVPTVVLGRYPLFGYDLMPLDGWVATTLHWVVDVAVMHWLQLPVAPQTAL